MWGERGIIDLAHCTDLTCLEYPAAYAGIGLQNRRRALLQHFAEPPLRKQTLARRQRRFELFRDLCERIHVLRQHRLFDKKRAVRAHRLLQHDRHRRRGSAVKVQRDIDTIPDRFASRLHPRHCLFDEARTFDRTHFRQRAELHRIVATCDLLLRVRRQLLVRISSQMLVDAYTIAHRSAEQLPDRNAE